jgi:hypothetical protein
MASTKKETAFKIRIMQAVNEPSLAHMRNVVVFSQQGNRPVPNEISGSDLDGDLFFVSWQDSLIPPSRKSYPPMDFPPATAADLHRVRLFGPHKSNFDSDVNNAQQR